MHRARESHLAPYVCTHGILPMVAGCPHVLLLLLVVVVNRVLVHHLDVPPWLVGKAALQALLFYVVSSAKTFVVFHVLLFHVASSN